MLLSRASFMLLSRVSLMILNRLLFMVLIRASFMDLNRLSFLLLNRLSIIYIYIYIEREREKEKEKAIPITHTGEKLNSIYGVGWGGAGFTRSMVCYGLIAPKIKPYQTITNHVCVQTSHGGSCCPYRSHMGPFISYMY
jgi:hypothetical protein